MTATEKRTKVVELGLGRKGKNQYSQDASKRLKVDSGYSDCSSFVRWCYLTAIGLDIGGYTVAQITNKKLIEVCLAKNGQPADEGKLLPGDLLYFAGTDASRPYKVGHVEMFISKNKLLGHGSGTGPTEKNMKDYCASRYKSGKGLIKILRVIPADSAGADTPATTTTQYPLGFGQRELCYGRAGEDVANLQRALISLNYSCGKWGADSEFGSATRSAVKAYQYDRKLSQDGIVGPLTRAALEKDLPAQGDTDEDKPAATGRTVVVQGGDAYIRDRGSTSGRILGVAKNGTTYPWGGEISPDGWPSVDLDGEVGFISGKYARVA